MDNTANLRQYLTAKLSDEDLQIFVYDYFRPVYDYYTNGQTKSERIHLLIEYTERHGELEKLSSLLGINQPPEKQPGNQEHICMQIIQARARLNTLLDVAERLDSMPGWLKQKIQSEHDILHDLKIRLMRI